MQTSDIVEPSPILVLGSVWEQMPSDLYIPPDAMRVLLQTFEGPLDLLLYLIRKQNLDILNIPMLDITRQYLQYIDLMQDLKLELAADYLLMAATLAEIKSRMLLPRQQEEGAGDDEEDPRAALVRRLQEYERFKQAAEDIDALHRVGRDVWPLCLAVDVAERPPEPDIALDQLAVIVMDMLKRAGLKQAHAIAKESLSVRERMTRILEEIPPGQMVPYTAFFTLEEGHQGLIVTFLAVLELVKESLLELVQAQPFAMIHLKAVNHEG